MTQTKLKELAEVSAGYHVREGISPASTGNHRVIQMKDILPDHSLLTSSLYMVNPDRTPERYTVRRGDLVFQARGEENFATPIEEELSNTIASGHFYILRLKTGAINSRFLAWYINQAPAQNHLSRFFQGTSTRMVPRQALEEMPIDTPPLKVQETIVKLHQLSLREHALLDELKRKRSLLIGATCLQAIRQ